jgi:alcohol dehydrogenase
MKTRGAVLWQTGKPLEVVDLELAPPGPSELLIKVQAAGLCHSDLSVIEGVRPRPTPMVLGHEAAGEVLEVGSAVDGVRVGDHVVLSFVPSCRDCPPCRDDQPALCEPGAASNASGELIGGGRRLSIDGGAVHHHLGVSAFSEFAVVDHRSAVVIDTDIPWPIAALFGCALLTGVGAVRNAVRLRPGRPAAVWGLGGVGLAALMALIADGAGPIIAIDPDPTKQQVARDLGATHSIGPDNDIRELLPGGVEVAIEAVGRVGALHAALEATGRGGTTVTVGLPHPQDLLSISPLRLVADARTLVGSYLGSGSAARDIPILIEDWKAGRLPVERLQSSTIDFADLNSAMSALQRGEVFRQVLLPHADSA